MKFDVTATDEDDDTLTYSWDFDGDGDSDSTAEDPTYTYTTAGTYEAEVTVSDGTDERTRTVTVTVFGADDPEARFRVLVFSRTTGFRHDSIPAGIAAIKQLGTAHDFQVDATEDPSVFNDAALAHYEAVVFLSTTGDPLNDTQQAAFERYIRAGGGYVGIHAAADTEYTWTWYGKLVGAYFRNHPAGTPEADVLVEDLDHHSTDRAAGPLAPDGRVVQLPAARGRGGRRRRHRLQPAGGRRARARHGRRDARTTRTTATRRMTTIRSRGASATTAAARGTRAWATRRRRSARRNFLEHLLGGLEVAAGAVPDDDCGNGPANKPPTVTALRNPGGDVQPGDPVAFTATGTDPDGDTLTYAWDFGDGGTATTKDAMHTYNEVGVYYAKVTVTRRQGRHGQRPAAGDRHAARR